MAARIAMMAMTTRSSMRVNAPRLGRGAFTFSFFDSMCQLWAADQVKLRRRQIGVGEYTIGWIVCQTLEGRCPRSIEISCGISGVGRTRLNGSPVKCGNTIACCYRRREGRRQVGDKVSEPERDHLIDDVPA